MEQVEHDPGFDAPTYFFGSNLTSVDAQNILRGARALVRLGSAFTAPTEAEMQLQAVRFYLTADLGTDDSFVAAIDENVAKFHDGLTEDQLQEELAFLRFPLSWNDADLTDDRSLLERCSAYLPAGVTLSQLDSDGNNAVA